MQEVYMFALSVKCWQQNRLPLAITDCLQRAVRVFYYP
ncbi:hypothetical protein FLA_4926 [Filimonas lacunae]|nr:hypothetical protein FLA_4926 [Filimonas lacunae]